MLNSAEHPISGPSFVIVFCNGPQYPTTQLDLSPETVSPVSVAPLSPAAPLSPVPGPRQDSSSLLPPLALASTSLNFYRICIVTNPLLFISALSCYSY